MNEATKLKQRWERDGIFNRYFSGAVLDVGAGDDKIIPEATGFDKAEGDGQVLGSIADLSFDTVFSSHFLEHVRDPLEALLSQWRVLRPGGYLIFLVPDEDLYERSCWPSVGNPDHKHTYTISKSASWSPVSKSLVDLIQYLPDHKVISLRTVDTGYLPGVEEDQTQTGAEAAIEGIIQKLPIQPPIVSQLDYLILCPHCLRGEIVIRGITPERKIAYWCRSCGLIADLSFGDLLRDPNEE